MNSSLTNQHDQASCTSTCCSTCSMCMMCSQKNLSCPQLSQFCEGHDRCVKQLCIENIQERCMLHPWRLQMKQLTSLGLELGTLWKPTDERPDLVWSCWWTEALVVGWQSCQRVGDYLTKANTRLWPEHGQLTHSSFGCILNWPGR